MEREKVTVEDFEVLEGGNEPKKVSPEPDYSAANMKKISEEKQRINLGKNFERLMAIVVEKAKEGRSCTPRYKLLEEEFPKKLTAARLRGLGYNVDIYEPNFSSYGSNNTTVGMGAVLGVLAGMAMDVNDLGPNNPQEYMIKISW